MSTDTNYQSDENEEGAPKVFSLPHTIKLKFPVELSETKVVDSITFQNRIKAKTMEKMESAEIPLSHMYPIMVHMTGERINVIREIDWEDLQECIEVVTYFLKGGRTGGAQPT